MTESFVPFQPNSAPRAGRDDAILYGAAVKDPGGLPKGTLEYLTFSRFDNVAGEPFDVTLHTTAPAGTATLSVPPGWTVDGPKPVGGKRRTAGNRVPAFGFHIPTDTAGTRIERNQMTV